MACRQAIDKVAFIFIDLVAFIFIDLVSHLTQSSWNIELEHALEKFSIRTYLDWFDQHQNIYGIMDDEFPERFLSHLKDKVSNPCS